MPVGANIPLVIQLGRWRRQATIANVVACTETVAPAALTHLPRNGSEGDLPKIAIATGQQDAIECLLRKIGIDDLEFSAPSGGGHVQLYSGMTLPGAALSGSPTEDALWGTQAALFQYDMVLLPCQGAAEALSDSARQNLMSYASAGGRVFATHWGRSWLSASPFSQTASFVSPGGASLADQNVFLDTSFAGGAELSQWLSFTQASVTPGEIPLTGLRNDLNSVNQASAQSWLTVNDSVVGTTPVLYSFETPVGAAAVQQCGRVVYADLESEITHTAAKSFPAECLSGSMTPTEKLVEYFLFGMETCAGEVSGN
ncbi:MAG TPA: hypothetical protein VNW92_30710 [Polyangiaceae bacterium]|nr:hypothetical protein [Polyangiaceae bacterium]